MQPDWFAELTGFRETSYDATGHELHGRHLAAEESHRMLDERLEGVGRLPRVAHVVVEDQRHQREGRRAVPGLTTP